MTRPALAFVFPLVVAPALVGGCGEKDKAPLAASEQAAPPASVLAASGVDAAVLGEADPPPPAGDLKQDLDHFVNLDTCVAERSKVDPLLGDALGAIGYETFVRDACRLLEATRDKKRESCDRIDSSALRHRCQSWVAIVAERPQDCPLQFEGLVTRGASQTCVALASKDPRLCTGETRTNQRTTCEALVTRDPAKCEGLLPSAKGLCQRDVTRWKTLLPAPLEGLPKLPVTKAKLVVHGADGTADPATPEADLSADFAAGVVVVRDGSRGARLRVELGTVVESESARIAVPPQKRSRVGLALIFPEEKRASRALVAVPPASPSIEKLELELPGESLVVSPPASSTCKLANARLTPLRGSEMTFTMSGVVSAGTRRYNVTLDVTTWVRDIVAESSGDRLVLPPVHPPVPARSATTPGLTPGEAKAVTPAVTPR